MKTGMTPTPTAHQGGFLPFGGCLIPTAQEAGPPGVVALSLHRILQAPSELVPERGHWSWLSWCRCADLSSLGRLASESERRRDAAPVEGRPEDLLGVWRGSILVRFRLSPPLLLCLSLLLCKQLFSDVLGAFGRYIVVVGVCKEHPTPRNRRRDRRGPTRWAALSRRGLDLT